MKCWLVGCALTIAATGGAHAADFVPLPGPGSTVLDLDTANGKYSAWQIRDLGKIDALRTTMQVHRLGDDPKWGPVFTIAIKAPDDEVLLQVKSETRSPPLTVHVRHLVGGNEVEDKIFMSTIGLDQKLDVAIDWKPTGEVTLRLGSGESQRVTLKGAPTSLEFTDSTGEVEFNPLRVGWLGP